MRKAGKPIIMMTLVATHMLLLAAYTLPDRFVPVRLRHLGQFYSRPLFHQEWKLFAPDPPLCSCEVQVVLGEEDPRPLYASDAHYLTKRMARSIAWYVQAEIKAGRTTVSNGMQDAMRAMVRDIGREVPDLRFQLVEHCVTDPSRPLHRTERTTSLKMDRP